MKDFKATCAVEPVDSLFVSDDGIGNRLFISTRRHDVMEGCVVLSAKDEARLLRALKRRAAKRKRRVKR